MFTWQFSHFQIVIFNVCRLSACMLLFIYLFFNCWSHHLSIMSVRPHGAMQGHQNVNKILPLYIAWFEVGYGPCFQLTTVPLTHSMHKCTEYSVFYCYFIAVCDLPAVLLLFFRCTSFLCFYVFSYEALDFPEESGFFSVMLKKILFIKRFQNSSPLYTASLIPKGHCFIVQDQCIIIIPKGDYILQQVQ